MPGTTETAFDRDQFAHMYAKRHFETDSGVEEIYYLPMNSPPREIRLLEVNRLISETIPPEPIDFGVDIDGAEGHTLFVLDLTPSQWEAIRKGEIPLPPGWTLDKAQKFSRH
jgi:hypothetical protein